MLKIGIGACLATIGLSVAASFVDITAEDASAEGGAAEVGLNTHDNGNNTAVDATETANADKKITQLLNLHLTVDFPELDIEDVVTFLQRNTKVNFVLDPALIAAGATPPVSLRLNDVSLKTALEFIALQTRCHWEIRDEAVFITAAADSSHDDDAAGTAGNATGPAPDVSAELTLQLEQQININWQEISVEEAVDFLRHNTNVNYVMDPRIYANAALPPISLRASNMQLQTVLRWIERMTDLRIAIHHDVIYLLDSDELPAGSVPLSNQQTAEPTSTDD